MPGSDPSGTALLAWRPQKNPNASWKLGPRQLFDLDWWSNQLSTPKIATKLCTQPIPDDSLRLFCDASSSWGIGVVMGHEYDHYQLDPS